MTQDYATQAVDKPVDKPQSASERLLEQTQNYVKELAQSLAEGHTQHFLDYLAVMGRFHHYSTRNQMLITLQCPKATRVAGLKRWNELGRKVKKGEKGIDILAPSLAKVELEVKDPETGEIYTEKQERLVGFHPTVVFDLNQTEGEPLPEPYRVEGQITGETLASVEKACPYPLYLLPFEARQDGLTDGRRIFLHPKLSPERRLLVLFHEWGHMLMHYEGCDYREDKTRLEAEAEAVAAVMGRFYNLKTEAHRDYILAWGGNPKGLTASLNSVATAVKEIVGKLELRPEK